MADLNKLKIELMCESNKSLTNDIANVLYMAE